MDFAATVQRQRTFFQSGATRPPEFRRSRLLKLQDAVAAHEPALMAALQEDLHKSPFQAYSSEIGFVLHEIRHALRNLRTWTKRRRRRTPLLVWPSRGFIRPEPYGVALIIGPWNYPFQLLFSPLTSAIAAGNCVVLKPSEFAPHTAAAVTHLVEETFPKDYVTVIQGGREEAEALLREKFDTVFFTGSSRVGRAVMTAAARHLTPVTLELGGKCPCLVCEDAPIETTARRIIWGKFMNAGQTCVAPDFVLAHQSVRAELVEAMKRAVGDFYGPDPRRSPDYGRLIHRSHLSRLVDHLGSGRIACGGQHDVDELYLAPTILTDVPADAPVMQEEIFGPILPVLDFTDLEEALALLRKRPTPLALYLFTRNRAIQEQVLGTVPSGGAAINDTVTHILGVDLPFGGLGDSGMGTYHGRAGFDCFTHRRSVLHRSATLDPGLLFPPATISLKVLKRVFRLLLNR